MRSRLRVFLAEDDPQLRRLIAEGLRRDGHFVLEAADGAALDPERNVIISDARMPGRDGLAVLHGIRQFSWCPPFILITAFADEQIRTEARRLGVYRVFDKPFDLDELREVVSGLAGSRQTVRADG